MTGVLEQQITRALPPGMRLPEPMGALFEWIEVNDLYEDRPAGYRLGFLFPEDELFESRTEVGRLGGTRILFNANADVIDRSSGLDRPEDRDRLCIFAKTGADGSTAAFWLDDAGEQRIVHVGSGSGSDTICVLADDPVDFMRLLAIGYDEICWGENFGSPPNEGPEDDDFVVQPNLAYRRWVETTFDVTIPKTALEIVKNPDSFDDDDSLDPFNRWLHERPPAFR